jgi:tRNA threonylcarbamoyladenosine biosynthesis protein TsaE
MKIKLISKNTNDTKSIASKLAPFLFEGSVVALAGDLGAGKTTFTSGIAQGLGISEHVISPTFNLLREYRHGRIPLFHIDAYRLEDGNADIGLEEYIDDGGISVVEWPQFIAVFIPANALKITIKIISNNKRTLEFETSEERYYPFFEIIKKVALC